MDVFILEKYRPCVSCGAYITSSNRTVKNPLRYKKGKNIGKVKPCCENPDWHKCENFDCEANHDGETPALMCISCGAYWGDITW